MDYILQWKGTIDLVRKMSVPPMNIVESDEVGNTQLCAVLETVGDISLKRAYVPEPTPDEVRIKIIWVGICGSDVEVFRGAREAEFISFPTRLGHEVAGIIDKVGENVIGLKVGDRVSLRYVWGAFAEYICCTPFSVKVLPDDFPLIEGSLIEVLPGIIHAAEIANVDPGKDVLIMGQGVSGLVMTQVISLFSPRNLVVTDLYEEKLELARKYGATHTYRLPSADTKTMDIVKRDFPGGFDIVIPCLLEGDGMVDAIDAAAQNGKIVMYGCIGTCHKPLDFFKIHKKRLDIFSTEPKRDIDNRRFFDEGLKLVLDGLVNTKEMITHIVPLKEIKHAFELKRNHSGGVIHVMINCEKDETSREELMNNV